MKKTWLIRAVLLAAYCVPFAYLSVKGDVTSGTMLYYGVMIVSFAILYRCAMKTDNVPIIFIGNILKHYGQGHKRQTEKRGLLTTSKG